MLAGEKKFKNLDGSQRRVSTRAILGTPSIGSVFGRVGELLIEKTLNCSGPGLI
jgi:hypothetical protein